MDVMSTDNGQKDASFQEDPEYYNFSCLSTEETWNSLDAQAREVSKEVKVSLWRVCVCAFCRIESNQLEF